MKVQNMTNDNGRSISNQFIITDEQHNRVTFQSYDSTIAIIDFNNGYIAIGEDWDYSTTTGKYRNKFFRDYGFIGIASKKGIEKALEVGGVGCCYVMTVEKYNRIMG